MKKNKGFTLVELLVIILILGIVAVIMIPSVEDVIDNSRKKTLRSTAINIERVVSQQCSEQKMDGSTVTPSYTINNNKISGDIDIKSLPEKGNIIINDDCSAIVSVVEGKYCAIKDGKEISISTNIYHCGESGYTDVDTSKECFIFDKTTRTITGYNFANTECPLDIVIPSKINGTLVEHVADKAFVNDSSAIIIAGYHTPDATLTKYDLYENILKKDLNFDAVMMKKILNTSTTKKCYYNGFTSYDTKPVNYIIDDEKYDGCDININDLYDTSLFKDIDKSPVKSVNLSKAYNLVSIGAMTFYNNNIEKVQFGSLPKLTTIGGGAFGSNSITGKLDLSGVRNLARIEANTFRENNITSLLLPSKIKYVGYCAFNNNKLDYIDLPNGLEEIVEYAFSGNMISSLKLPDGLKKLGGFSGNYLTEISIPDNVEEIGYSALNSNNFTSIIIPSSVKEIKDWAFYNNQLTKVEFNEGLEKIGKSAFMLNQITDIKLPSTIKELGAGSFTINNVPISKRYIYNIVNGVEDKTYLVSYAGPRVRHITIDVPTNILTIGESAFTNIIPEVYNMPSVKVIKKNAFEYHYSTPSNINIGSAITTIEDDAFFCETGLSYCRYNININRIANAITGSPWGNSGATVNWKGTE